MDSHGLRQLLNLINQLHKQIPGHSRLLHRLGFHTVKLAAGCHGRYIGKLLQGVLLNIAGIERLDPRPVQIFPDFLQQGMIGPVIGKPVHHRKIFPCMYRTPGAVRLAEI